MERTSPSVPEVALRFVDLMETLAAWQQNQMAYAQHLAQRTALLEQAAQERAVRAPA